MKPVNLDMYLIIAGQGPAMHIVIKLFPFIMFNSVKASLPLSIDQMP